MGSIRDQIPAELLKRGEDLAAKNLESAAGPKSEVIVDADDTLGVYTMRLSNREKLLLRDLAVKTGRPAAEIARDFIRQGLENSVSETGKIKPGSDLGLRYLATIAESISAIADVLELEDVKLGGSTKQASHSKGPRKRA